MAIDIPTKPNEKQYEEFAASVINALGYFIETRIELRKESTQVLELDMVATPSGDHFLNKMLIETKSSTWGFSDIFKLFGWMTFLNIERGILIHLKKVENKDTTIIDKIGKELNIGCYHLSTEIKDINSVVDPCVTLSQEIFEKVVSCGWFSQIAKRIAFTQFIHHCKSNKHSDLIKKARSYFWSVQESFFEKRPLSRVSSLYRAFQESPNLTGEFVKEVASGKHSSKIIWDKLNDSEELLWLQYIMLLEHNARIAIIKNALEHELGGYKVKLKIKMKGKTIAIWNLKDMLPDNFIKAIEQLKKHPYGKRVPFLFQVFICLFGGFYNEDNDDEMILLSKITGIPKDLIPDCLDFMNLFFPIPTNWFYKKNELKRIKMVPSFMRGTGCFLRQVIFDLKSYTDMYPNMGWVLSKWHNALYKILEPELKIEQ